MLPRIVLAKTHLALGLMLSIVLVSCGGERDQISQRDSLPIADTFDAAAHDSLAADTTLEELLDQARDSAVDGAQSAGGAEGVVVEGAESVDRGAGRDRSAADEPDPSGDGSAPATETAPGSLPLAAPYRLVSVDAALLPVILVEGPDCVVELISGDVRIRDDRTFELKTSTHENCGGEIRNHQLQQAAGMVVLDGARLRFDATDGEAFAVAHGRYLPAGHIVIERLEFEGGEHEVQWEFVR